MLLGYFSANGEKICGQNYLKSKFREIQGEIKINFLNKNT